MDENENPAEQDAAAPRKPTARLRIESSGTIWGDPGTKVYLDGVDISSAVTAVTWQIACGSGHDEATATVTFMHAEVAVEADLDQTDEEAGQQS